jgi:hypothetical protein
MTKDEFEKNKDKMIPFECENGSTYMAFNNSCVFCKNCEIFWDYTNGPYKFICSVCGEPENYGMSGNCRLFERDDNR